DYLRREMEYCYPDCASELLANVSDTTVSREQIVASLMQQGLHLNRRIFANSRGVIVHDRWCLEQIQTLLPEYVAKATVVPHGASVQPSAFDLRPTLRTRFGLPQDALVFASFGSLHPLKMNVETVLAFAAVAREYPLAHLLFVGDESGGAEARNKVRE